MYDLRDGERKRGQKKIDDFFSFKKTRIAQQVIVDKRGV